MENPSKEDFLPLWLKVIALVLTTGVGLSLNLEQFLSRIFPDEDPVIPVFLLCVLLVICILWLSQIGISLVRWLIKRRDLSEKSHRVYSILAYSVGASSFVICILLIFVLGKNIGRINSIMQPLPKGLCGVIQDVDSSKRYLHRAKVRLVSFDRSKYLGKDSSAIDKFGRYSLRGIQEMPRNAWLQTQIPKTEDSTCEGEFCDVFFIPASLGSGQLIPAESIIGKEEYYLLHSLLPCDEITNSVTDE